MICVEKKFDAGPKEIHQREFVEQLKKLDNNGNATDADNDQSMFVLQKTIAEKIKETRLNFLTKKQELI